MEDDSMKKRLYEMRLADIYNKYDWLKYELSLKDFIKLFPVHYRGSKALLPDKPQGLDLDRSIFLEILVAFRQSFS
jgi:hypothetical protein